MELENRQTEIAPNKRVALLVLTDPALGSEMRRDLVHKHVQKVPRSSVDGAESAIKRELKRNDPAVKSHPNNSLPILHEACMAGVLLHFDRKAAQLTDADVLKMAQSAFPDLATDLSLHWCKGFRTRFAPWLTKRKSSAIEAERVKGIHRQHIQGFIDSYDSMKRFILEDGSNLVNADEVPCAFAGVTSIQVYSALGKPKCGSLNNKSEDVRTFIPFTAANGELLMLVVIFKAKVQGGQISQTPVDIPESWTNERKNPFPILYAATGKGYVTNALWKSIMQHFGFVVAQQFGIKGCVLLVDNLAAHVNAENVAACSKQNIFMWMIPAHSSHFLQPNDNGVNAAAKSKAHELKRTEYRANIIRGITPTAVVSSILLDAIEASITKRVVRASWYRTGIFPWDPEMIWSIAEPYLPAEPKTRSSNPRQLSKDILTSLATTVFEQNQLTPTKRARVRADATKVYTFQEIADRSEEKKKAESGRLARAEARRASLEEKRLDQEIRKAVARERRSTIQEVTQAKKRKLAETTAKTACMNCHKVRATSTPWFSCPGIGHPGVCSKCYRKALNDPDELPWCAECDAIFAALI
jgi:hypothetical protein